MMNNLLSKIPPQSIEAEMAVLAAAMFGGANELIELLDIDDFYRTANQKIYAAISQLVKMDREVDLISVIDQMRNTSTIDDVGGVKYVSGLVDGVPVATRISTYAKIIKSSSARRKLISICNDTINRCMSDPDVNEIIGSHELSLSSMKLHGGTFHHVGEILSDVIDRIEETERNPEIAGMKCGLVDIDNFLGGFRGGNLYIIGARPSMGKSALGMRICRGAAKFGANVLQLNFEMSKEQLIYREISCESGVDSYRLTSGQIGDSWPRITDASERIHVLPMWVDDTPRSTIKEVAAKIRHFVLLHGNKSLITVDFLDFITGLKSERKDLEIGTITKGLKAAAKSYNVPIILFSQLNRECEKRDDKRPEIKDLRSSGEIEQDADVIAFIYRDDYYNPGSPEPGIAEIIFRKNRNGKQHAIIKLAWIAHRTTFENLARR